MIDMLIALVHPVALALILFGAVGLDIWLIERRGRRPAPPPDTH